MKGFLIDLQRRNAVLYGYGWLCFAGTLLCLLMTQLTDTVVLGINAWIKPMKFFVSVGIFCWTIAWYMAYLTQQRKVRTYSRMVLFVMSYELAVITWQAANGRLSHFNNSAPFYQILFAVMGIAISVLAVWTGYVGYLFFRQKRFPVPMPYVWGIRLGILFFVIFSFEGGLMAARLAHTVGAPDGGPGLPVVNWSKHYGDLRIAHFIGLHALQLLPLAGFFVAKTNRSIQLVSAVYFLFTLFLFIQAISAIPLFF
ncbi:hypothetical protein GCM10027299_14450 [Larkinella ripae]